MDDEAAHEKRAIRRFVLQLPVTVTGPLGEQVQATTKTRDVSSHGICFYCDTALEREAAIEFTLTLPAEVTMTEPVSVRCHGKVVRVEGSSEGGKFAIAAAIESYEFIASGETRGSDADADADAPPIL